MEYNTFDAIGLAFAEWVARGQGWDFSFRLKPGDEDRIRAEIDDGARDSYNYGKNVLVAVRCVMIDMMVNQYGHTEEHALSEADRMYAEFEGDA